MSIPGLPVVPSSALPTEVRTGSKADREAYTAHSRTLGMPASPSAEGTGALDHLAFTGDDHEEAVARLERRGIEAKRNTVPGIGMRQLFFKDPNGVKIEINVMPAEGGKED